MLLHRLQKSGLCLGRSAVDFVGQDHVGEDRSLDKLHAAAAVAGLLEDLGAGDVGRHQVGCELNSLELQVKDLGDRANQQGLRQPGRAGDQAMAAGEQADQELMRRLLLADDHLRELALDPAAAFVDLLDGLALVFIGIDVVRHDSSPHTAILKISRCTARSMRHGIGHDVDAHRIRFLFRELMEILIRSRLRAPSRRPGRCCGR